MPATALKQGSVLLLCLNVKWWQPRAAARHVKDASTSAFLLYECKLDFFITKISTANLQPIQTAPILVVSLWPEQEIFPNRTPWRSAENLKVGGNNN